MPKLALIAEKRRRFMGDSESKEGNEINAGATASI